MGRKLNLSHLSEAECEQILSVLQKDFQVRRAEKKRVNAVHSELVKEQSRISLLKEKTKFNDNSCVVCLERFGIFLRRKRKCFKCELNVCPSCCSEVVREGKKVSICTVCTKEKAYRLLSNEWQGRKAKGNPKNYGTARVVRSLYKRFSSSLSDTELDSGYPASSVSSVPHKPRPRLDQVFDLDLDGQPGKQADEDDPNDHNDPNDPHGDDEFGEGDLGIDYDDEMGYDEAPITSPTSTRPSPLLSKPIARATSLDTLIVSPRPQPRAEPLPPRPLSVTPVGGSVQNLSTQPAHSQDVVRRARTPDHRSHSGSSRPRSQDFDLQRANRRRGKDTHGLYREALEGAKRSEEFKFRVKFDKLLGDLHLAIEEKSPNGLPNSFASPSYGEVMLIFREKVKDILRGFSQRLILAYDSFGSSDNPEQIALLVKQDISRFVEDLVGETLDLTSDEAVSDLSSLSDDSAVDQNSFEDLIAQAVVSKLLDNHRREVSGALFGDRNRSSSTLSLNDSNGGGTNVVRLLVKDQATETNSDPRSQARDDENINVNGNSRVNVPRLAANSQQGRQPQTQSTGVGDDSVDGPPRRKEGKFSRHRRRRDSVESLFSNRSELIPDFGHDDDSEESDGDDDDNAFSGDNYGDEDYVNEERNHVDNANSKQRSSTPRRRKDLRGSSSSLERDANNSRNNNYYNNNDIDYALRSPHLTSNGGNDSVISQGNDENFHGVNGQRRENYEEEDEVSAININNNDVDGNGGDDVADVVKDFEELKAFVRQTQATARPRIEAKLIDESQIVEVEEEQLAKTVVAHEEKNDEFHTRLTALDRVRSAEPPLPDFSQFEHIDFDSNEVDPDLLSMNLAIIPEETEEELEEEEEEEDEEGKAPGRWRANWIFKGKGVSPYENVGKKKMTVETEQPLYMTVPNPGGDWTPWRDAEQGSDNSDSDLLNGSDLDNSEDDETSFYPDTSRELARVLGSRHRSQRSERSSSFGHDDLRDDSDVDTVLTSDIQSRDDMSLVTEDTLEDIPGPIIEPAKQELKLLTDLVAAENDDPKFVVPPESVTIQEGEPVKFSCQVTGTPPVDVFWYREGDEVEELEDSEDVELSSNGDKHSVTLYNIGKQMAGQYMCIALSDTGKAVQYLVVTVKDNKQELKKPEFLKGLADVEVSEGQSVKFRVKVKGYPPPRISWYKDGAFLRSSKACRIEKFGNRDYILTIDYATMDDDAEYSVSARNVAGETRSSAQVIVEPQSEFPPKKQQRAPTSSSYTPSSVLSKSYSTPKSFEAATPTTTTTAASSSSSPSYQQASPSESPAVRRRQEQLQLTQLDNKLSVTQKRLEEEAGKMQEDAEKLSTINCTLDAVDLRLATLESSFPRFPSLSDPGGEEEEGSGLHGGVNTRPGGRMLTSSILDILHTAQETLQHEREEAGPPVPTSPPLQPHSSTKTTDSHQNDTETQSLKSQQQQQSLLSSSPPSSSVHTTTSLAPKTSGDDEILGSLPDTLEEFPMPGLKPKAPTPGKSTFNMTIQNRNAATPSSRFDDEISASKRGGTATAAVAAKSNRVRSDSRSESSSVTGGDQDTSFDSGKDNSITVSVSLHSSISSDSSLKEYRDDPMAGDISRQQAQRKGHYSRDYEVAVSSAASPETKKWSVTLDPFSPKAEIVNRESGNKDKGLAITFTDLAPMDDHQTASSSSNRGEDNSGQSSPRQSVDSGIFVHRPKERPAPVHMVGDTSEHDMPESRTEFNVDDGAIELPSVNRLRAMFSSGAGAGASMGSTSTNSSRDDLGDGSFKRRSLTDENQNVHSITARSVSKKQLENLRAMNQTGPSSTSPSSSSPSPSSTSSHLQVPGLSSKSSATLQLAPSPSSSSSSSSLPLSSSSSSSLSSTPSRVAVKSSPRQPVSSSKSRASKAGKYEVVEPHKEPVLIYPPIEEDTSVSQHKRLQQQQQPEVQNNNNNNNSSNNTGPFGNVNTTLKSNRDPQSPISKSTPAFTSPSPSSPTSSTSSVQLAKTPRAKPRLIVRRASETASEDQEASGKSTPRIKSGCISARAAFWERKMVDGSDLDSEEFPDMVEESDSSSGK